MDVQECFGLHGDKSYRHLNSDLNLVAVPQYSERVSLYKGLAETTPNKAMRNDAVTFLRQELAFVASQPCLIPESIEELNFWMQASAQKATSQYSDYLKDRKDGAPRRYFGSRAHALYFLRTVAPTKLVDGAWLYGLMPRWSNTRFTHLIQTYVEELGEGLPDKNHVLIYRQLLLRYGLDPIEDLDDAFFTQGLVQLALGWNPEEFLPEIIGFNLGYEQLPAHLLITSYELSELGLDPYYFTLHVTVDNAGTGHARRAVQAVMDILPRHDNAETFWQRVRHGSQLALSGLSTTEIISSFNIEREIVRILAQKSVTGHGAHSDYLRIAGRTVNEWLADSNQIPEFLTALQNTGFIQRGQSPEKSRFWRLLQGQRAEMFGVFSDYELQVIYDWIRDPANVDGQAFDKPEVQAVNGHQGELRFGRRFIARATGPYSEESQHLKLNDPDLNALIYKLRRVDETRRAGVLIKAMSPSQHWTPAGLYATQLFCKQAI